MALSCRAQTRQACAAPALLAPLAVSSDPDVPAFDLRWAGLGWPVNRKRGRKRGQVHFPVRKRRQVISPPSGAPHPPVASAVTAPAHLRQLAVCTRACRLLRRWVAVTSRRLATTVRVSRGVPGPGRCGRGCPWLAEPASYRQAIRQLPSATWIGENYKVSRRCFRLEREPRTSSESRAPSHGEDVCQIPTP
jgi:hypothetical protein